MDTNNQCSSNDKVCSICEQGDLGLFGDPLNESDQKKYTDQIIKENQEQQNK